MKHKITALFLCVILISSLTAHASAGSGTTAYTLDELDMTISIPDELVVFTRDIDENDPNLVAYGMTADQLSDIFTSRSAYLSALEKNKDYTIVVTMVETLLDDFATASGKTLNTYASNSAAGYENYGYISYYEVVRHGQTKFIKCDVSEMGETDSPFLVQYYTVYGKRMISIAIHSNPGGIGEAEENLLKGIIDSIHFDAEPRKADKDTAYAASNRYHDKDGEMSFALPDGWVEELLDDESESLDVQFISQKEDGPVILLGSTDYWTYIAETTGLPLAGVRPFASISMTASGFASIYDMDESDVETIAYDGLEFYIIETDAREPNPDIYRNVTMTIAVTIDDGYLYLFEFTGTDESPFYEDFESVLSSVRFD